MKKGKRKILRMMPLAMGLLCAGGPVLAVPALSSYEYAVNQQTGQVTGIVKDANGEPLIGVNVVEKGNVQNGSITDLDGRFKLNVGPNAVLVCSYIGYKTVEVPCQRAEEPYRYFA